MQDKKIFFVLGSFKLGGTERTASRIGLELLRRGYNVKFLIINRIFDYDDEELIRNSIVLSNNKNKLIKIFSAYSKLLYLTWRNMPHRLISFSLGLNLFAFFTFYPKSIFRIEANIFIYKKKLYRRYLQKIINVFPQNKKVVVPSVGLANACKDYFLCSSKVTHIDNPIDIREIDILKKVEIIETDITSSNYIVSAGRLHKNKGFYQLIEMYAKSKLPENNIRLIILGNGPDFKNLQNLINKLDLADKVYLLGFVKNPYKYFHQAKYFVLNSSHESFGNVIIEAFSCDICVLSNDCDFGPRHIISDNFNGLLFNNKNETEFLKTLNLIIDKPELIEELNTNASQTKYKFEVEEVVNTWENIILK